MCVRACACVARFLSRSFARTKLISPPGESSSKKEKKEKKEKKKEKKPSRTEPLLLEHREGDGRLHSSQQKIRVVTM